jgi:hypothetical protein
MADGLLRLRAIVDSADDSSFDGRLSASITER